MNIDNEDRKVAMLLNIDSFYGESESRLGPTIKMLLLGFAPMLAWVWTGFLVPNIIFWPFQVIWFVRIAMITVGREGERLKQFKKQLHDDYSAASELLNIKTIHEDGCIEYTNGTVAYILVAANGSFYDPLARSKTVRQMFALFGKDFDIDIVVQNVTEMKSLEQRYNNVRLFADAEAAKDFIDIIDHNRKVVYSESRLVRILFIVKARKTWWTEVRDSCKMAVQSNAARAFKDIHLATRAEVSDILNTDIRGFVDTDKILQQKFANHQYYGSKVLYFGEEPKDVVTEENIIKEERGFLISEQNDSGNQ